MVAQAVAGGHEVTAVVRDPRRSAPTDGLRVVTATFDRTSALDDAVRGRHAVISALGTDPAVEGVTGVYYRRHRQCATPPVSYDRRLQERVREASERLVRTARRVGP